MKTLLRQKVGKNKDNLSITKEFKKKIECRIQTKNYGTFGANGLDFKRFHIPAIFYISFQKTRCRFYQGYVVMV